MNDHWNNLASDCWNPDNNNDGTSIVKLTGTQYEISYASIHVTIAAVRGMILRSNGDYRVLLLSNTEIEALITLERIRADYIRQYPRAQLIYSNHEMYRYKNHGRTITIYSFAATTKNLRGLYADFIVFQSNYYADHTIRVQDAIMQCILPILRMKDTCYFHITSE